MGLPNGSEHHGRSYTTETDALFAANVPRSALALYTVLIRWAKAQRDKTKIWAGDDTLKTKSNLSRSALYRALKWLKENETIHTKRESGKRVIYWGPAPIPTPEPAPVALRVIQPVKPAEVKMEPNEQNRQRKQIEEFKQGAGMWTDENPPQVRDTAEDWVPKKPGKIPETGHPSDVTPKGVEPVEYRQRRQQLRQMEWYSESQITDVLHYAPGVTAAYIRAYGKTREQRPDAKSHNALFEWHCKESANGRQGVIIDPEPLARAAHTIHLGRPYAEAELNGTKLDWISAEDLKAKQSAEYVPPTISTEARAKLAELKQKIRKLPTTWIQ